jgi:hypothetical protein
MPILTEEMTLRKRRTAGWVTILVLLATFLMGGSAGAVFDNIGPSPRTRAMGGAFAALADDGCAVFYNPAGLSQLTNYHLFSSYHRPYGLDFLEHMAASVTVPLPKYGVMGLGFQKFAVTYGDQDLQSEKTFSLSHGFSVMSDVHSSLALGYTLNLYALEFGTSHLGQSLGSAQTVGVDLGLIAVLRSRTRMGAAIRNLNQPRMGKGYREDLPRYMTFGVAYQPYPGVVSLLDLSKKFGEETRLDGGIEAQIASFVALRFGVQTKPDRVMGGLGFNYGGVHFDYALITHSVLPLTHQFAISYRFGRD